MKTEVTFLFLFTVIVLVVQPTSSAALLNVNHYQKSCPAAETAIKKAVYRSLAADPNLGAGLIRLHFHDCFVRGCDGSVLLNSTRGKLAERDSTANIGLRGFEVVEAAKAAVEVECPGVVSCADVLALAARDSAAMLGGISYEVPCGRYDGVVSLEEEPIKKIPSSMMTLDELEDNFADQGLTVEDLVVLSGAHSIGVAHCESFGQRLYVFNSTHPQDPSMDENLAEVLKDICPPSARKFPQPTSPLDFATPNRLDNRYYANVEKRRGVFRSDQVLLDSHITRRLVKEYATEREGWKVQFAAAMVKMGSIPGTHTAAPFQAQIRRVCSRIN